MLHSFHHPILRPGRTPQPPSQPPKALMVAAVYREHRAVQLVEEGSLFRPDEVKLVTPVPLVKGDQLGPQVLDKGTP